MGPPLPENVQKLMLAPPKSTQWYLGLDKRKTQSIDTRANTKTKHVNNYNQKNGPRFDQFGHEHHREILLYKHGLKKQSLQAIKDQCSCGKRPITCGNLQFTAGSPCTKPTHTTHGAYRWPRQILTTARSTAHLAHQKSSRHFNLFIKC